MVFAGLQNLAELIFNPVLSPLLELPPVFTILIIAAFISVVSVLVQKYFTNQERLKFLKKETKKFQEQIKKHKDDQEKQLKIHKKMMPIQGEMMRESLKPTLWMILPFMLLFFWLSAHFAFEPIVPSESFMIEAQTKDLSSVLLTPPSGVTALSPLDAPVIDGTAKWELVADMGAHALVFSGAGSEVTKELIVTKEKEYATPLSTYSGNIRSIEIMNPPLKPLDPFTIFGWRPGWIWVYIFFSLVLSISLRKILDVA